MTSRKGRLRMESTKALPRLGDEYDACGLYGRIEKSGVSTREVVRSGLQALDALKHRSGSVAGEGDGCGLMLDIPVLLWQRWLSEANVASERIEDERFFVAHLLLDGTQHERCLDWVHQTLQTVGATVLVERVNPVHKMALGLIARRDLPSFVQIAGLSQDGSEACLYRLALDLESQGVHVASINRSTVVYKVIGDASTLWHYYPDLQDDQCTSAFVLAHTRFSTNTATKFSRVQPFMTLGHNGEINTIARFQTECEMVGLPMSNAFSDSQMMDQGLHGLVAAHGLSLFEAMEILFPPILHEVRTMPKPLAEMYKTQRALWGPFCQGPAAVMVRLGDEAVFSVDALGLRPLWYIETADAHCFCSEQGLIDVSQWVSDPKPLAPGEKWGVKWRADRVVLYNYNHLIDEVYTRWRHHTYPRVDDTGWTQATEPRHAQTHRTDEGRPLLFRAAAFGWRDSDIKTLEEGARSGAEPIHSLGYDGPLAALAQGPRLLSDFLQETVAVVTNPAIDREREVEHFSTRVVLGTRPSFQGAMRETPRLEVKFPLLLERLPKHLEGTFDEMDALAQRLGAVSYEAVLATLRTNRFATFELPIHRGEGEGCQSALHRFAQEAVEAARLGAHVIVLDDRQQFRRGGAIDPFLSVRAVHAALVQTAHVGQERLRRHTSLILRSASIRNLHDVMIAIGLGADAVNPYLLWELAAERGGLIGVENTYLALCKGIEKVISTLGIHELRGYERLFAAIGLKDEVTSLLGIAAFCGSSSVGYGFVEMDTDAERRHSYLLERSDNKWVGQRKPFRLYPRLWKSVGQVARGEIDYSTFYERLRQHEVANPVNLKHGLDMRRENGCEKLQKREGDGTSSDESVEGMVDTTIDGHAYPFVISSMSFGSQGETAYRAYAEAAYQLNIVALNGEGGEIKDLLDAYPRNRGRQVASGRFGVNAELCNGTYLLEIKIGQGAKPGEGGHLPGSKVTQRVANARNSAVGVDLISPSNNHDIYSIEDLAQVIHELRQINPDARIAVKAPVVPNIGTIAVGIVKAGADIVNLSGFDGGTGAARGHAIEHVGLPAEIGIALVHDALCEAGLRDGVEVWADGGMKSGADVVKSILLGANRVGFGTMAMVAIGCTACRACQKDTCHVGIATQITTEQEAIERGLPAFSPRSLGEAVCHLKRLFTEIGAHVRRLTAELGALRTQDLVGRRDLLVQVAMHHQVDLSLLTTVIDRYQGMGSRLCIRTIAGNAGASSEDEMTMEMVVGAGSVASAWDRAQVQRPVRGAGIRESGERVRRRQHNSVVAPDAFTVAGNGFAAYHTVGMYSVAHGGAEDGVGKGAYGGRIVVLKGRGADGVWRGGSVGKGIGYGAQRGLLIVQGSADARAGVRLSGADLVIGGVVESTHAKTWGWAAAQSNIKGFAFEYMTAGRALVMGDPGPWMCSGMTGGTVYVRHDPSRGLTVERLRTRLAKGAKVHLSVLDMQGERDVTELLLAYHKELRRSGQSTAAKGLIRYILQPADHFRMIRPGHHLTDQTIATE